MIDPVHAVEVRVAALVAEVRDARTGVTKTNAAGGVEGQILAASTAEEMTMTTGEIARGIAMMSLATKRTRKTLPRGMD